MTGHSTFSRFPKLTKPTNGFVSYQRHSLSGLNALQRYKGAYSTAPTGKVLTTLDYCWPNLLGLQNTPFYLQKSKTPLTSVLDIH